MPSRLFRRLRLLFRRDRFEHDLDDELRFHLEMQTTKYIEGGLAPADARARAEREFGAVPRYKDEVRDVRGITWADDLRRDVRFAVRGLGRSPAFLIIAVLCLGLGIGANAAIFSVVSATLLEPLPFGEPDRLVRIFEAQGESFTGSVSDPNYRSWAEQATGYQGFAAYSVTNLNLQRSGEPERVRAVAVTAELFDVLDVRPLMGRTFLAGEDRPGSLPVVVISERFWERALGRDPAVLSATLMLDGTARTVIGVMPASFDFPTSRLATDIWVPYVPTAVQASSRGSRFLNVIARVRDGVAPERAEAQLKEVAARLAEEFPGSNANRSVLVQPMRELILSSVRGPLILLLGAVALVLLIACANVANLLLARAATRRQEVAIRTALGASRGRLVRQFLVESVMLALAGAALGAVVAWWSLAALRPLVEGALPRLGEITIDLRVFGYLMVVAVLSGLAFGVVPALSLSRGSVRDSLIASGGKASSDAGHQRFRSGLVVVEIALSLILLVGAGLLIRGFVQLRGVAPGLAVDGVLTAYMAVPAGKYDTNQVTPRLTRPVLERIRDIPGVRSAGLISMLPIQEAWTNVGYQIEGETPPADGAPPRWVEFRFASPHLFESLGIPLRAGRDFTEGEGLRGENTIIVNETFVKKHFEGVDPIGKRVITFGAPWTIVGVIGDVRGAGLDQPPLAEMYIPYDQRGFDRFTTTMVLVARTSGAPETIAAAMRQAVLRVDPTQPLYAVRTMEEVISQSLSSRRLNMILLGSFAAIAVVLAAAGLFGVISYLVSQRTREIGIRVALGAQARDVIRLVLRHGMLLVVIGVALGLAGALGLTRFLEGMLYGVGTRDPITFAVLAVLLAIVALVATWLPARRAAGVDPLLAIRTE